VPISMQRAEAHANNPYADKDDVGLIVAFDSENECVGYFGVMPIRLRQGDKLDKVHWFTTWNVSSKVRGMGVGTRLMEVALSMEQDYVIVGSVYARRVCRKFGFWEREPLVFFNLDVTGLERLNPLTIFLRLLRKTLKILPISGIEVGISNSASQKINKLLSPLTKKFFFALLAPVWKRKLGGVLYNEVSLIKKEPPRQNRSYQVEFHRGIEAVNWMLNYPWVVEPGKSPTENMDYYFSDVRQIFRFITLEVFLESDDSYLGFVILSLSQEAETRSVKTLDYHLDHPKGSQIVFSLALNYGAQFQADRIELPAEVAEHIRGGLLGNLLLHEKNRVYQCHPQSSNSPLARAWSKIHFRLSDGDMPFT